MSRTKTSIVRALEIIGAGAVIWGLMKDQMLWGIAISLVALGVIFAINHSED